jgi:DNA-binding transcriptional LysR family regulator
MNHWTALRHINQLEASLGIKLFIRHQRGYQLTSAGELMMAEFPKIAHQFSLLEDALCSAEKNISGNLLITTAPGHAPLLNPAFKKFRHSHPKLRIQIIATDEILSLASGDAHVSIRAGKKPDEADLIVKKLATFGIHYYASTSYIKQHGLPADSSEFKQHLWALPSADKRHIPFVRQVLDHISEEHIIYQSNIFSDISSAVIEGMAIGPIANFTASKADNVQAVTAINHQMQDDLWFVYHKDLKNSSRIQALYGFFAEGLG